MSPDEAEKLGIALMIPPGDKCPECGSPNYSCGTRQSARIVFGGRSYFKSHTCYSIGERIVLDRIQEWNKEDGE